MDAHEHLRKYPLNVVLSALGFDTFKYRKSGTEGYGACPVHGSQHNTTCFSFNDDGLWRCFSCPAKGKGALDLVMAVRKCGFKDAVAFLQGLAVATLTKRLEKQPPHVEAVSLTENPPFKSSYSKYFVPSDWLAKRGILPATLEKFGVGQYDNPKRKSAYTGKIMLPVRRWQDGELVAYLARDPRAEAERGTDPKYVWPRGFQKALEVFGGWQIKNSGQKLPLRIVFAVESPFTVMKFDQLGFPAVSCFGWSASEQQAAILGELARGVVFLPDRDKYAEASSTAGELSRRLWVKMPELPDGVDDPENMNAEQIRALS